MPRLECIDSTMVVLKQLNKVAKMAVHCNVLVRR